MSFKVQMRVAILLVLSLGAVEAQLPGTFTATGSMTTRRYRHTATLLADGRVLIAGGEMMELNPLRFTALSSAELYDPHTGTFTATGSMNAARYSHTATLLPNGKVLIAGGSVDNDATPPTTLASAEIYDPDTGAFSATGDMTAARVFATATLLNNGNALIAAGASQTGSLSSAELYDPSTGTFAATGNMTSGGADTSTLLADGRVLITRSAFYGTQHPPFLAELYDPTSGTFAGTANTNMNHGGPTANLLMNGEVLIAGGDAGNTGDPTWIAELYDPVAATFTTTAHMITGRLQNTAVGLSDGTVLFAGGHDVINLAASAETYDPVTRVFASTGSMAGDRELHTSTLLQDGRVLIAGGDDERYWIPETILSSAEIYTPSVLMPTPVLLSLSGDGQGQGAIQHANTVRIASADDPAVAGEYLAIYLTGLADGSVIPPQIAIGGRLAEITFFGNVSGYPGLNVVTWLLGRLR